MLLVIKNDGGIMMDACTRFSQSELIRHPVFPPANFQKNIDGPGMIPPAQTSSHLLSDKVQAVM
jgi:hypothetical protein